MVKEIFVNVVASDFRSRLLAFLWASVELSHRSRVAFHSNHENLEPLLILCISKVNAMTTHLNPNRIVLIVHLLLLPLCFHIKHLLLSLRFRTENTCCCRSAFAQKTLVAVAPLSHRKHLLLRLIVVETGRLLGDQRYR